MSWWDIGEGKVIGDGPADAMLLALSGLAEERTEAGRPKPSLESVLGGTAAVLAGDGDRPPRILASLADGREVEPGSARADVLLALREGLAEVERQYEERWARPPEQRELLETLLFVLAGSAESCLRDLDGSDLGRIEVRE